MVNPLFSSFYHENCKITFTISLIITLLSVLYCTQGNKLTPLFDYLTVDVLDHTDQFFGSTTTYVSLNSPRAPCSQQLNKSLSGNTVNLQWISFLPMLSPKAQPSAYIVLQLTIHHLSLDGQNKCFIQDWGLQMWRTLRFKDQYTKKPWKSSCLGAN